VFLVQVTSNRWSGVTLFFFFFVWCRSIDHNFARVDDVED
jgi:hypothetical protein